MITKDYQQPSASDISSILRRFSIAPDDLLISRIQIYLELLDRWNRGVSLTSLRDPLDIVRTHFAESLFALRAVPIEHGRLADVGTGAGFPGFALKLGCPDLEVTLIESNARKCAFLSELKRALEMKGISVIRSGYVDFKLATNRFDSIVARALGGYTSLLKWASAALTPTGRVILWLGRSETGALSSLEKWYWMPPVLIPLSRQRFILAGSPRRP
ncbi:MAG: 16S rRNA (guanine(527)-N(7))-methyltransferase RsmG [Candidatus Acidiferrales bacterium]